MTVPETPKGSAVTTAFAAGLWTARTGGVRSIVTIRSALDSLYDSLGCCVTSKALLQKIEMLPPERQTEVEHYVDCLLTGGKEHLSRELLAEIDAGREALARRHGLIETDAILRALREDGDG